MRYPQGIPYIPSHGSEYVKRARELYLELQIQTQLKNMTDKRNNTCTPTYSCEGL